MHNKNPTSVTKRTHNLNTSMHIHKNQFTQLDCSSRPSMELCVLHPIQPPAYKASTVRMHNFSCQKTPIYGIKYVQ